MQENKGGQFTTGFRIVSDWLRRWRDGPITDQNNAKSKQTLITFATKLKYVRKWTKTKKNITNQRPKTKTMLVS